MYWVGVGKISKGSKNSVPEAVQVLYQFLARRNNFPSLCNLQKYSPCFDSVSDWYLLLCLFLQTFAAGHACCMATRCVT